MDGTISFHKNTCTLSDEELQKVSGGFDDANFPIFVLGSHVKIVCNVPKSPGGVDGAVVMDCDAEIIGVYNTSASAQDWKYEVRFVQWADWNALSLTMNEYAREAALRLLGTTSHFTGQALVLNGNG